MSVSSNTKPFALIKPKSKKFIYVRFKTETGKYGPSRSTGTTDKRQAEQVAWAMVNQGLPKKGETVSLEFESVLARIKTLTESEKRVLAAELRKNGTFALVVEHETEAAVNFGEFLLNFWDYENSAYIKQKNSEKANSLHRRYAHDQQAAVRNYWIPFFQGRLLGQIDRGMIKAFRKHINGVVTKRGKVLSAERKTCIMLAGGLPLKWAVNEGLVPVNPAVGLIQFSRNSKKREILSPEIAGYILGKANLWGDERSRVASIVASVSGMRAGELQALRVMDIGQDKIHVKHGWNKRDELKCPKGRKQRVVYVPRGIIGLLLDLAGKNPHGTAPDSFVFWNDFTPDKPVEDSKFLCGLREALLNSGMSGDTAKEYVFHSWRHFFTTHMSRVLDKSLLKTQTGHADDNMINLYSDHELESDETKIRQAQEQAFGFVGNLLPKPTNQNLLTA